jgi:hypothetical protein
MVRMVFKGRGGRGGVRGELAGLPATPEEVEALTVQLCELVAQDKHRKAAERLVAWLNDANLAGAGLLTVFTALRVTEACLGFGVPVEQLDNRAPQIPGVLMLKAVSATLKAQTLVTSMIDRERAGQNAQPTEDELVQLWQDEESGCLAVYYYLQCLVTATIAQLSTGSE